VIYLLNLYQPAYYSYALVTSIQLLFKYIAMSDHFIKFKAIIFNDNRIL